MCTAVWVVVGILTAHVFCQALPKDACTGNSDCGDCTKQSGCVWCDSPWWGGICIEGDFFGPSNNYTQNVYNKSMCDKYFQNQCIFDGYMALGTNYLWQVIVAGVLLVVIVLCCLCGCTYLCKKHDASEIFGNCCSCSCGGISESDVVRAPVRGGERTKGGPKGGGGRDGGVESGNRGGGGGGTRTNSSKQDSVTIAKLAITEPVKKQAPVKLINLEDLDKTRLPPGFPPEPPKPVYTGSIPPSGREEEGSYKDYMRSRLAYEQWENSLLLWHRKNAASPNPVVW